MIDKKKIQSKPLLTPLKAIILLILLAIIAYKDPRVGIICILIYATYMFAFIVTDNPENYGNLSKDKTLSKDSDTNEKDILKKENVLLQESQRITHPQID